MRVRKIRIILFICFLIGMFIMPNFNIKADSVSLLNLENPVSNSTQNTKLNISGWIMSTDVNTNIKIYINNTEITEEIIRIPRKDVIKAIKNYGDNATNPTPGFFSNIDLSGYKDGVYTITVNAIDSNNKIINSINRNIVVVKAKALLNIENYKQYIEGTKLSISGWYMCDLDNANLNISIDGKKIDNIERYNRPDVIKAIKNYGDSTRNPTPGFLSDIDLSDYKDGTHTITIEVVNPVTYEIIEKISKVIILKKSKTLLNVEVPNENVTVGTSFNVSGWFMTTSRDNDIRIMLDDNIITDINKIQRNDVIRAIKNYGDSTTNPTPGFIAKIGTNNYEDGNHTLKIQVFNKKTSEVIHQQIKRINVNKYRTLMNVESPSIEKINSNHIKVSGWMMSTNSNQSIKIFINNKEVAVANRVLRPDVIKAITNYGDGTTNPSPGFVSDIDLSSYKDGKYTLRIDAYDFNTGKILDSQSKNIELKKYNSLLNIETLNNSDVKTTLDLNGWFMTTSTNSSIKLYVDGNEITEPNRINRPDVIKAIKEYGDSTTNPTPGYSKQVNLENYLDGTHLIKVVAIDNITNETLTSKSIRFNMNKYKSLIVIEDPDFKKNIHGTTLDLSGWIMTDSPSVYVKVNLDDTEISDFSITRKTRNDVIKAINGYGDSTTNPTPGYDIIADLSKYKDGNHRITVSVFNKSTNEKLSTSSQVIYLKKYEGIIHLESPNRSTFNSSFTLSGWEMSESDDSYLELYIDGNKININIERLSRNDVVNSIKDYGAPTVNLTPGFTSKIDLSNFSDGNHNLEIKLISKYGDELYSVSKKILIYRKVYFGIDVSYYQNNINFKTLKNEGIDFTMIRLGYRGYGTGKIAMDIKSRQYITDAINNNMDIGLYFFSQAINVQEAIEEADFMINNINLLGISNKIKYPIVFDSEYSTSARNGRADGLSKQQRTNVAKAFLNRIKEKGYIPMIYASKSFLYDNLDMNQLQDYDVWVAHYNGTTDPINSVTDYSGIYQMWQYTSKGSIAGIVGNVDLDIAYKKY